MDRNRRALIALVVLFSGLLLLPFFTLPAEAVEWQRYIGGYETPTPTVTVPATSIEQNQIEATSGKAVPTWLILSLIGTAAIVGLGWWTFRRSRQLE
ncbi:MAG: hypothetical protein ACRDIB_12975 [Ardenticatenaceae bacterium]